MSAEFFEPGRNCWTVENAAYAGAIIDTRDYYRAFARAALEAKRQIFLSGWQFDTTVELVRGADAAHFPAPRALLPFLSHLCERTPTLQIYVLAWNFSVVFGADREWMQPRMFAWRGHPRLHFVFDSRHPVGACQHQKLAVVDGHWAFTGGMDICNSRWDTPGHGAFDLRRNADGKPYPPKHDVQVALEGAPARALAHWFVAKWRAATKRPIETPVTVAHPRRPFSATVEFGASPVALSQTRGRTILPPRRAIKEIQHLFEQAILRADHTIYMENQYFTSRAVRDALVRRLFDPRRGKLDVALLIPRERAALEFYSIAGAETRMIREIRRLALSRGHRFGVYHPMARNAAGDWESIWVHTKMLMVDDAFLTLGSANLDNRSMGFDTEVNASWWAETNPALSAAISELRARLLAEHAGQENWAPLRTARVIDVLDDAVRRGKVTDYRPPKLSRLVERFRSEHTILDPAAPTLDEQIARFMEDSPNNPIRRGLRSLLEWMSLRPRRARQREEARENVEETRKRAETRAREAASRR